MSGSDRGGAEPQVAARTFSAEELARGRHLFAQPCDFVRAVAKLDQLPHDRGDEVAFAGRSNVGKSSLVNALTGRHTLARTSNTPGRTQQLIVFDLGGRLTLVDLPGYGYAEAPKTLVQGWTGLLSRYLKGRAGLRRALVLVDARHGLKPNDIEMMGQLDRAAVPYQLVLTKADKVRAAALVQVRAATEAALKRHTAAFPLVHLTSARDGDGIDELRADLASLASG
jgi:GTP-binding protein